MDDFGQEAQNLEFFYSGSSENRTICKIFRDWNILQTEILSTISYSNEYFADLIKLLPQSREIIKNMITNSEEKIILNLLLMMELSKKMEANDFPKIPERKIIKSLLEEYPKANFKRGEIVEQVTILINHFSVIENWLKRWRS